MPAPAPAWSVDRLKEVIAQHWGFRSLRPLQEPAMRAVLDGRDSLVVLPTGGGKSLCYQAPAVLRGDTTVVISPLISLMKDQVDALQACAVPAIQIDSSQTPAEQYAYLQDVAQGAVRLLFLSPERLVLTDIYRVLQKVGVRTFAIDEAHCISHWGHDFRPEYRQLNRLREFFPDASVHGYTATATERVRRDIVAQLGLRHAEVLVGNFDRPNLTYRVLPKLDVLKQALEVIDRHKNEAGIVYCIRRKDVDELTAGLQSHGVKALPYHAGLAAEQRQATQNAFANEECDLVVATVAFGMGIDRSNVRFVLHTGMPKSLEHYQQETGRAGRDGLEAECVLLYSGADYQTWKYILEKSAEEAQVERAVLEAGVKHLTDMTRYANGAVCRHRALVEYFGQKLDAELCGACDLCLGDTEPVPEALVVAQKILSCVARVKEKFGVNHVVGVLRGENTEAVRKWEHDKLSTYGLLREHGKADVCDWVYQLIGQGVLWREEIPLPNGLTAPILRLNPASWEVMKGQRTVRLVQPMRRAKGESPKKSKAEAVSWEGVDRDLFEALRELRLKLAQKNKVPPYVIFSDATLREMARARPSTLPGIRLLYGVGDAKLRDYGEAFLQIICDHCKQHGLAMDVAAAPPSREPAEKSESLSVGASLALDLFRQGASMAEVMEKLTRARSTVCQYLAEFIRRDRPASIAAWVPDATYHRIAAAARQVGSDRLKPIFLALGEQVPYDDIRLVVTHLEALAGKAEGK